MLNKTHHMIIPKFDSIGYSQKLGHGPLDETKNRQWYGSDTEELFKQNMSARKTKKILTDLEWNNESITYRPNDMGFRMDNSFKSIIPGSCDFYLGCSITFGIGLNLEDTWAWKMSQRLDHTMVNLSAPGGSMEHQYRYTKCWVELLRPKRAFTLGAFYGRREVLNDETYGCALGAWLIKQGPDDARDTYLKICSERELDISQFRAFDALRAVCKDYDVELYSINDEYRDELFSSLEKHQFKARDLIHPGKDWNTHIANLSDSYWERLA
jgi:hypothetical protein